MLHNDFLFALYWHLNWHLNSLHPTLNLLNCSGRCHHLFLIHYWHIKLLARFLNNRNLRINQLLCSKRRRAASNYLRLLGSRDLEDLGFNELWLALNNSWLFICNIMCLIKGLGLVVDSLILISG